MGDLGGYVRIDAGHGRSDVAEDVIVGVRTGAR